ncbi:MAG: 23S rRNA (adenine(2503)-C(2))-methyltransferase RlmN, partial [Flavobacteriaceae bacterium]
EYNAIGDNQFVQAKPASISAYISALEGQNISVTVRQSRGNDIDAACGQLANKQQ